MSGAVSGIEAAAIAEHVRVARSFLKHQTPPNLQMALENLLAAVEGLVADFEPVEWFVCLGVNHPRVMAGPFPDYEKAELERKHFEKRSWSAAQAGYHIRSKAKSAKEFAS